ncbi:MAG TPA: hypothetical protein PLS50_09220, partial [Candidatus Dojkabacteria bacterium]|nr:hypothetical protein [Candidatus Dojkabacteria bacterium]
VFRLWRLNQESSVVCHFDDRRRNLTNETLNMKFKYTIKKTLEIQNDVLEEKIIKYLTKKSYRITERGSGYIIFIEDEFSDRRISKYDFHTRIGEGKFVFNYSTNHETNLELIYLTSISYYAVLVMLVCAFGIYTNNIMMPVVFSFTFSLPILFKIFYLNNRVFEEIMEC